MGRMNKTTYRFQPQTANTPIVSVILPFYNAARYLDASLGSIRRQTLENIEIICVDDGSTDSSPQLVERHIAEDHRIVLLRQPNQGVYAARNNGLSHARGEFVYFFDSDDILLPEALETAHATMVRDNLDVCLFSADTFYERNSLRWSHPQFHNRYRLTGQYPGVHTGEELVEMTVKNDDTRIVVWLQMIRRDLLVRHNIWFTELRVRMDNLFSFQVQTAAERAECLPDVLVRRRVRAGSLVTTVAQQADFDGHMTSVVLMLKALATTNPSPGLLAAATTWVSWQFYSAKLSLSQIPADQRRSPTFDDPLEAMLASFLFNQAQEYVKFLSSAPGRFTTAVLYVPRKVREIVRSLGRR